jgi:NAD(P)-dependent dehydrogenase (short-subunit alcohol dehydrogenase family)
MTREAPLAGRGVGITGGGGHLGRAMALAAAVAGATVVVCGRTADPLQRVRDAHAEAEHPDGRIVPVVADVSTDAGLAEALDALEAAAGRIDGWVNNAYTAEGGRLGELRREDVEATLARGLADVLMATQAAAARMNEGGAIVNIASMYGLVSPQPAAYRRHPEFHNPPAYGAAKAGVIAFTRYAAIHLAERGIRVNAIAPGAFPGGAAAEDEAFVDELRQRVPLGRVGRPDELGDALVFLLGDGSSYVTGHTLVVDGGWTAW